jgi:taurine dioxygenase
MSLNTNPLAPALGEHVSDVDVRKLSDTEIEELKDLWRRRSVLLFRDQDLSADEQMDFARRMGSLGDLGDAALDEPGVHGRHVMVISNREYQGKPGALPDGEMWLHYDQLYLPVPLAGGILYGIVIPSEGGNTRFVSTSAAYAALPQATKDRLVGLDAKHVYDYRATTARVEFDESVKSCVHPIVIQHPTTGLPVLYVSPLMTHEIIGLDPAESQELLQQLFDHIAQPEFMYEHVWRVGDLIMWDNNQVLHARTDFDPGEARTLRRLSLANDGAPLGYAAA